MNFTLNLRYKQSNSMKNIVWQMEINLNKENNVWIIILLIKVRNYFVVTPIWLPSMLDFLWIRHDDIYNFRKYSRMNLNLFFRMFHIISLSTVLIVNCEDKN